MTDLLEFWPLAGLRLTSGDLELRPPSEDDVAGLAAIARDGVHDPAFMPFLVPWTDAPPVERGRSVVQWLARQLAEWQPNNWTLPLVVVRFGEVVGLQELAAKDFAVTKSVSTGSYLGLAHQGRGTGTRMRRMVLALAFDGLGAIEAHSGAFEDNTASRAVSRAAGYADNGSATRPRRGRPTTELRFILRRADWERGVRPEVDITGLDACRHEFGA